MLSITSAVRIFLWTAPIDMRQGFDGLSGPERAGGHNIFGVARTQTGPGCDWRPTLRAAGIR